MPLGGIRVLSKLKGAAAETSSVTDRLVVEFERAGVAACTLYNFSSLGSTMDIAALLASDDTRQSVDAICSPRRIGIGSRSLFVVLSGAQTSGRGREGRSWVSNPEKGIYVSYVLSNLKDKMDLSGLSLVVGLAVVEALASLGIDAKHKWPNDVFCCSRNGHWKKIAGILVDASSSENKLRSVIVGLGVDLEAQGLEEAIGIRELSRQDLSRSEIAGKISEAVLRFIKGFSLEGFPPYISAWEKSSLVLKKKVSIVTRETTLKGTVSGIGDDGALLLEGSEGLQRVYTGSLRIEEDL